jgi:ribose/xylose/arabinose/galactoside ABC-type transport system permease subunit
VRTDAESPAAASLAAAGGSVATRARVLDLSSSNRLRLFHFLSVFGSPIALAALVIYFALTTSYFLTVDNLLNIGRFASVSGIVAAAFTVALIAGQIDLTLSQVVTTAGVTFGVLVERADWPMWQAIVAVALLCVLIGLVNGVLVVDLGVYSFVATLGTAFVLTGVPLAITGLNDQSIFLTERSEPLHRFANSELEGVPVILLLMLALYGVLYVVMSHTRFGWHVYATGSNPDAARRSGINVGRIYRTCFLLTALTCGVAALIVAGQVNYTASSTGTAGVSLTLSVLAAVLIGGADLGGGFGSVQRTLVGVLLVGVLQNGLVLKGVDAYGQLMATGVVFVLAVLLASLARKHGAR